eukprot:3313956-Rhodomonas_salina.1
MRMPGGCPGLSAAGWRSVTGRSLGEEFKAGPVVDLVDLDLKQRRQPLVVLRVPCKQPSTRSGTAHFRKPGTQKCRGSVRL